MDKTKATPRPYVYHKQRGSFDRFYVRNANSIPVARECSEANARFIVKACNAHDALVAACEAAETAIHDAAHAGNLSRAYSNNAIGKIEAALALARKEAE